MFMFDICKGDREKGLIVFRSAGMEEELGEAFSKVVLGDSGMS